MKQDPNSLPGALAARYEVRAFLGAGAAARVLRAHDTELQRDVAIKLLVGGSVLASPGRFLDEARALSRLRHPNIVEVYDFGAVRECVYLVLEYAGGGSLLDEVCAAAVPPERVREVGLALLDALDHAHQNGILHRDVKAENVLLTDDRIPKLADFGLAKHRESGVRTRTGLLVGTPNFMAPELFEGTAATPAADLYAWGCLLHLVQTGEHLREGDLREIVQQARTGQLPQRARVGPLRDVVRRATDPDPRARANVHELRGLLRQAFQGPRERRTQQRPRVVAPARPDAAALNPRTRMASAQDIEQQPPAPPPRRVPLPLLISGAGLLALGVAAWALRGPTPPPPAPTPSVAAAPARSFSERWRSQLRTVELRAEVRRLHQVTYGKPDAAFETYHETQRHPGGERYQLAMVNTRIPGWVEQNDISCAKPDLAALDEAVAALPLVAEVERERAALTSWISDPAEPFDERLEVYRRLEALADLDAYIEAWGRPPAYRAEPIRRALVPVRLVEENVRDGETVSVKTGLEFPRPDVTEPVLPEGEAPTGQHLLHHWALDPARAMPFLLQDPDNLSQGQAATMNLWATFTFNVGSKRFEPYRDMRRVVTLPPHPGGVYRRLRLRLVLANLMAPDAVRVDWNDTRILVRPPVRLCRRWTYISAVEPEYSFDIDLPRELWKEGENRLKVRVRSMTGLNHRQGCDLYEVRLLADPAQ